MNPVFERLFVFTFSFSFPANRRRKIHRGLAIRSRMFTGKEEEKKKKTKKDGGLVEVDWLKEEQMFYISNNEEYNQG